MTGIVSFFIEQGFFKFPFVKIQQKLM